MHKINEFGNAEFKKYNIETRKIENQENLYFIHLGHPFSSYLTI